MNQFAYGLVAFILLHVGVSATGLRSIIVKRIGEGPYRGLFSLASAATLFWMIWGFGQMRRNPYDGLNADLWTPPYWTHWPAWALIFCGFMLGVTGILTPGPTFVGFEGSVKKEEPARGVLRITRNPFLWGIALWAAGHLLVNGERFALMLFGGLGLMVLLGARSIDRKARARNPEAWARFEAVTSNIPFAAIAQGRNKLVLGEMSWRPIAALAVFVLFGLLHQRIIGAPAFPVQW